MICLVSTAHIAPFHRKRIKIKIKFCKNKSGKYLKNIFINIILTNHNYYSKRQVLNDFCYTTFICIPGSDTVKLLLPNYWYITYIFLELNPLILISPQGTLYLTMGLGD